MITIRISGPTGEGKTKLAGKFQSWLQVEGHVVRKYDDESAMPEKLPEDAAYIIIVTQEDKP